MATEITINAEELASIHKKLTAFMAELPEKEASAMALILARASAAKQTHEKEVAEHLVSRTGGPTMPTLGELAKSIDGVSRHSAPDWTYAVWTYKF